MAIRDSLTNFGGKVVEELERATGDPDARSVDRYPGITAGNKVSRGDGLDKHYPEKKKIQEYWKLYKNIPIIRHPIRSFASEVIAPGYYVDSENEDLKEDLEDWLSECAIVDGEVGKDFRFLLKKAIVQREVKGSALSEKVETENGNLYGFKLMKPETIRAFTKPGQTVLLPPDYDVEEYEQDDGIFGSLVSNQDFYKTEDGDVAAYVQLDEAVLGGDRGYYIPFTREQIIKLTRDPDVGDVFGESRLTSVENRLQSLLKKLEDNDKAIESLAHPFQLIQFGDGDSDDWEPEEIKSFMSQHSQEDFEPGMKQGVQGSISIETVSGEVAPIEEFLDFDLNWIISEMPVPKYALGGFESDVNQFVSRSQETRLENQIQEARKEIEKEWGPYMEEKVEELGYDTEDFNGFHIGQDPSEMQLVPAEDADNVPDGNNSNENNVGAGGTNFTRPPASTEEDRVEDENEMKEQIKQEVISEINDGEE